MGATPTPGRNGQPLSLVDCALRYYQRGWRIIPTREKKAAVKWKQYQTNAPDAKTVKNWFRRGGIDGVAVLMGSASGGLACRDYDTDDAYQRWANSRPDL